MNEEIPKGKCVTIVLPHSPAPMKSLLVSNSLEVLLIFGNWISPGM